MKRRCVIFYNFFLVAAFGLTAGLVSADSVQAFSFTREVKNYAENFNGYRGTADTLPDHLFVEWDRSRPDMDDPERPFTGVNAGAFTAYTSDNVGFSFGIRERDPEDLRDARLYFKFINNTGSPITEFQVSYDVEAWYLGDRRNRIRLKYDTELGGGRFEEDIFSTENPSPATTTGELNGSLAQNRVTVTGRVDLATSRDPDGEPFGALAPGETAYFRWQFSNTYRDDSGSARSGLGINNISITVLP